MKLYRLSLVVVLAGFSAFSAEPAAKPLAPVVVPEVDMLRLEKLDLQKQNLQLQLQLLQTLQSQASEQASRLKADFDASVAAAFQRAGLSSEQYELDGKTRMFVPKPPAEKSGK